MTVEAVRADADWRPGFDATLQHLGLLMGKEHGLRRRRHEAEEQLLHGLAAAFAAGEIGLGELGTLHNQYVAVAAEGFRKRWNDAMPFEANFDLVRYEMRRENEPPRDEPNGPHGSWQGTVPIFAKPAPPAGACVVYVLFDAANAPCYVGSTGNFRSRMSDHQHDKDFVRWAAYPCEDREAAYRLEARLLAEHKPYLNKRAGR